MKQLSSIETDNPVANQEWGTFKESLRALIHSWFTYPTGFSYKPLSQAYKPMVLLYTTHS